LPSGSPRESVEYKVVFQAEFGRHCRSGSRPVGLGTPAGYVHIGGLGQGVGGAVFQFPDLVS